MTENEQIFKSYQRLLLRDLEAIKLAIHENKTAVALEMIEQLIKDTEKDIKDER